MSSKRQKTIEAFFQSQQTSSDSTSFPQSFVDLSVNVVPQAGATLSAPLEVPVLNNPKSTACAIFKARM
jgi:hypothetical protein